MHRAGFKRCWSAQGCPWLQQNMGRAVASATCRPGHPSSRRVDSRVCRRTSPGPRFRGDWHLLQTGRLLCCRHCTRVRGLPRSDDHDRCRDVVRKSFHIGPALRAHILARVVYKLRSDLPDFRGCPLTIRCLYHNAVIHMRDVSSGDAARYVDSIPVRDAGGTSCSEKLHSAIESWSIRTWSRSTCAVSACTAILREKSYRAPMSYAWHLFFCKMTAVEDPP